MKMARGLFGALRLLNVLFGAIFSTLLVLSVPFAATLVAHLRAKYGPAMDVETVIAAVRCMLALGILAVVPMQVLLTAVIRMLRTVEAGDPFVAANAHRLQAIGWALLGVQLLDGAFGVVVHRLARTGANMGSGWSPALAGWMAVVLVFVLARVFAQGTAMRDELEMTV